MNDPISTTWGKTGYIVSKANQFRHQQRQARPLPLTSQINVRRWVPQGFPTGLVFRVSGARDILLIIGEGDALLLGCYVTTHFLRCVLGVQTFVCVIFFGKSSGRTMKKVQSKLRRFSPQDSKQGKRDGLAKKGG